MIKTKSLYDAAEEADGKRVLITRYYPRFWKTSDYEEWLRELSPSAKLLKQYKSGKISWQVFTRDFRGELRSASSKDALNRLALVAAEENVTLLCYEREGKRCHRHIVSAIISQKIGKLKRRYLTHNFKIKEYRS